MNKKLLMVLGSTAAVAAVSIGGTLALFSDAKSATGDFAAGTLCITSERNDGDTTPGPMFYITAEQGQTPDGLLGTLPTGVWAPGDSVTRTLNVYNPRSCSTMDAWLTAVSARLTEGIPNQYVQMADELTVVISTPYGEGSNAPTVTVAEAPLRDFLDGPCRFAIQMAARSKFTSPVLGRCSSTLPSTATPATSSRTRRWLSTSSSTPSRCGTTRKLRLPRAPGQTTRGSGWMAFATLLPS